MRFVAEWYRVDDILGLTHRVRDTEERMIVDEAMEPSDAGDLADAMNSIAQEYAE